MSRTSSKPLNILVWSICLTAILAAMLGAATVWLVERTHTGEQWVRHSREAQNQIAQVLILAQRTETSQRGYLLTGRALYLDNYENAETALRAAVDKTARLLTDNPKQEETVVRLRQIVADKLRELRTTIDEQKAGRSDAARAIVNSDRGLQMMSQIRQLLSDMESEEDRLLSTRLSDLRKTGTLLQAGAPTAFLLICALGALVFVYMRRSFADLTMALQQREHSEARLQLALDSAQLGWWHYDPLHRVVSGDVRFKEIFGIVEDESTLEEAMKWVYLDDAERVGAAREAALDPGDPKPLALEHRIQRRGGEIRWVEAHGLASFEGAGRERKAVRFVGTVADITERKENSEKANLLTREINHRAKNMLSVVDAIAQRIAAGDATNFAQRFSERIQALSANQDLLIRNEWKGVGIEGLVRAQLAHFADLVASRIAIQGPKLLLKGASAQAIGLALHELATNAGKYGALSTDSGRVDIRWSCDNGTFRMSWTEHDGPPVSAPERRGFGTTVMKAMAERSLDGTVDLEYAPSGVRWRLTCPVRNALSAGNDQEYRSRPAAS